MSTLLRMWGPTCLLIYGVQRPELWAGSCGAVVATRQGRVPLRVA